MRDRVDALLMACLVEAQKQSDREVTLSSSTQLIPPLPHVPMVPMAMKEEPGAEDFGTPAGEGSGQDAEAAEENDGESSSCQEMAGLRQQSEAVANTPPSGVVKRQRIKFAQSPAQVTTFNPRKAVRKKKLVCRHPGCESCINNSLKGALSHANSYVTILQWD